VLLGFAGRFCPFEHLFDEVDAAAWAVELVTQHLVGGAGGGAKAAMHTLAQYGFCCLPLGGALKLWGQMGLHGGGGLNERFKFLRFKGLNTNDRD